MSQKSLLMPARHFWCSKHSYCKIFVWVVAYIIAMMLLVNMLNKATRKYHCHACSCKWKSNLNVFVFLCPQNTSCCRYTVRVLLEFNHVGTYNPCKGNHFTCYTVERFLLLSGVFKQWSCKEALFSNIVNITLLFCEQQNSQTRHYLNSHVLVHMQY